MSGQERSTSVNGIKINYDKANRLHLNEAGRETEKDEDRQEIEEEIDHQETETGTGGEVGKEGIEKVC